mmetsp:Transcript_30782/g.91507  ORF Transcript_30782/g.91507 Transcript_30782/m.91507 type:complete len:329 (+) Transcript_30782:1863-2849(+)
MQRSRQGGGSAFLVVVAEAGFDIPFAHARAIAAWCSSGLTWLLGAYPAPPPSRLALLVLLQNPLKQRPQPRAIQRRHRCACPPFLSTQHPSFHFRMSAPLGTVTMSHWQLKHLLKALHGEWEGSRYDKLHLNCCHFCDALCDALGVRRPPRWLNRLANSANTAVVVTHGAIDTVRIGLPHREANRLAGRQAGTDCLAKQTLGFAHSGSQNVQPTPRCNPFACDVHVLHNMDQRRPLSPTHAKAPPPAQPLPPPLPLILASHHPLHIASLAHAAAHPNLAVPRPSLSVCRTSKRRRPPSRPPRLLHIQIWSPPSPIRTFKPCRTLNSLV